MDEEVANYLCFQEVVFSHFLSLVDFLFFVDFQDDPTEATQEEIKQEALKWIQRCKIGASITVTIWLAWIITSQVMRDHLPASLFMLAPDDSAMTGW